MTTYLEAAARLLSEGYDPKDVNLRAVIQRELREMVRFEARFHLSGQGLDHPDAEKYGTWADGEPRHAPEWYAVQSVVTGINEALGPLLIDLFRCAESDRCGLDNGHEGRCWDGHRGEWVDA